MSSDLLDESRPDASERRRHPRFPAHQRLVGYLTSPRLPVHVRDVGLGGFCIETVEPLEPGVVQTVRFTTVDDWSAMLPARSLHCRPSVAADGTPRYATGFAFVDETKSLRTVQHLIEQVTSIKLYES
jgi:hypothetical protein